MKWSIVRERKWLYVGPFFSILTKKNWLGAMSRKLAIFKLRNYVHMGTFFHIIANVVWEWSWWNDRFSEKKTGFAGYFVHRFSWRNVRIFKRENWIWLTLSCVIFILIMESSWIHCHVRKLLRNNTLCKEHTAYNKQTSTHIRCYKINSCNTYASRARWLLARPCIKHLHLSWAAARRNVGDMFNSDSW